MKFNWAKEKQLKEKIGPIKELSIETMKGIVTHSRRQSTLECCERRSLFLVSRVQNLVQCINEMGWLKKENILIEHEKHENVRIENSKKYALKIENLQQSK